MAVLALRARRPSGSSPLAKSVRRIGLQKLLSTRICDLELRPTGALAECVEQVISEMRARGITFVPAFYLGDDDFWTSDQAVSVNIPWYLATPDLWRLVNDHLFEYSREEVLMYLRHEAGHALCYAYGLWRRRDWVAMFGDFRRPYRDVYGPNPWSRDFVRYLHWTGMYHYAQKHPDEDWAETFAVWLDPLSRWRRRYRDWQVALAKLEYVDRILEVEGVCRGSPPNARLGLRVPYTEIRETVAEYFDIGDEVDKDLIEYRKDLLDIFPRQKPPRQPVAGVLGRRAVPAGRQDSRRSLTGSLTGSLTRSLTKDRFGHTAQSLSAARFIQQNQQMLVDRLSGWIESADKRVISRFLRQLQAVCTDERMIVPENQRTEKLVELTIVATWHVVDGIHRLS